VLIVQLPENQKRERSFERI